MASCALISFRLGGVDGVSIEAAKWANALVALGHEVRLVAGRGGDGVHIIDGLDLDDQSGIDVSALNEALRDIDVIIVENMLSLPINPRASNAIARVLRGRRAIIRHHDLATDRADTMSWWPPPDDDAWLHVAIAPPVAAALKEVGIHATVLWNHFDMTKPVTTVEQAREHFSIPASDLVFLQPTRAVPRKNIECSIAIAEALHATFWLTGPAEDNYQPRLDELLARTRVPVRRGVDPDPIALAYAACDLVLLPSTREGFGNPIVESISQGRPLVLGHFPVSQCLRDIGFKFLDPDDIDAIAAWLEQPNEAVLQANYDLAAPLFDIAHLPERLAEILSASTF